MVFLYDLGIFLYSLFIRIASLKNKKAEKWLSGRKDLFQHIRRSLDLSGKSVWFHFASLGEFEQGRPVIEQLRKLRPDATLVITFFSPSGYEIRKNYPLADHVFYLPLDTRSNAEQFIRLINPQVAVFTKYEYWFHYFKILKRNEIPLYMISSIFRKDQVFFKWYGGLNRKILDFVTHFFVQNENSRSLLAGLGLTNVTVSGDTRFDRVYDNAAHPRDIEWVKRFSEGANVLVGGSTWPEDEALLAEMVNGHPGWRFIIAPHEIREAGIAATERAFPDAIRYSTLSAMSPDQPVPSKRTLIIDNVGMLSSLYQYGKIAFIGGGFGAGIHNTLEAAAFGVPVIFGPEYRKFQEARDLIDTGGGFSVKNYAELEKIMDRLGDPGELYRAGQAAAVYVAGKTGATAIILEELAGRVS